MKIPKVNLEMYWENFCHVLNGEWSIGLTVAVISAATVLGFFAIVALIVLIGLAYKTPVPFFVTIALYSIVRLGYAAVKGK